MNLKRFGLFIMIFLSACVVDNRASEDESEDDPQSLDAAISVDDSVSQSEPDNGPTLQTCDQEDDLFGVTPSPIDVGFSRDDLFLCDGVRDQFLLQASGEAVLVKLTASPNRNDLDLAILDESGNVLSESAGDNGSETITYRFEPDQLSVIIQVSGYQGVSSSYALNVLNTCEADRDCPIGAVCNREFGVCEEASPVECGEDEFESNNREDQAAPIEEFPAQFTAVICGDDVDWFSFALERGDILDVLVTFPSGVDLDLRVLKADGGAEVTSALGDARSNPERIQISHAEGGTYLLGISRYIQDDENDGDVNYSVEMVGRSGGCATNADCLTPQQPICEEGICTAPSDLVGLGEICGRDEDCDESADLCYEGFSGGQDNICTIGCRSDEACEALGEGAYCNPISFREAVCVLACSANEDCGDFYVCTAGRCAVDTECRIDADCSQGRVCRTTRSGDRYCAQPRSEAPCGQDVDLEPNASFDAAQMMPLDQRIQDLRICNQDDDYFVFEVPELAADANPWRMRVETSFRMGTDIDIYVYDARGNALGESITPNQTTEAVEVDFLAPGPIYVRVDQFDSDRLTDTTYSLLVTLEVADARCTATADQCADTDPLRLVCDEALGACVALEGMGLIGLGERCDSGDDCVDAAQFCSTFDQDRPPICTRSCELQNECDDVGETSCVQVGRGFSICL